MKNRNLDKKILAEAFSSYGYFEDEKGTAGKVISNLVGIYGIDPDEAEKYMSAVSEFLSEKNLITTTDIVKRDGKRMVVRGSFQEVVSHFKKKVDTEVRESRINPQNYSILIQGAFQAEIINPIFTTEGGLQIIKDTAYECIDCYITSGSWPKGMTSLDYYQMLSHFGFSREECYNGLADNQ